MAKKEIVTRYLSSDEFGEWDQFIEALPEGSIFYKTTWLKAIYGIQNVRFKILVSLNSQEEIIGGIVLGEKRKLGFRFFVPPKYTPYYGYVSRPGAAMSLIRASSQDYIQSKFSPGTIDVRDYLWNGFTGNIQYTHVLEVPEKEETVFKGFDYAIRKQINKAQKNDYLIKKGADENMINEFYDLQEEAFKRQKHDFTFSKQQLTDLINAAGEEAVFIYTGYIENAPAFSQIVIRDKKTVYHWLAGGSPQFFSTGLNQLLFWEIIKDAIDLKYRYFDFCGANTASIARYKSGYNFPLVSNFMVEKRNGRLLRLLLSIKGQ